LKKIKHGGVLAHRAERGHAPIYYQLVYELFTLLRDKGEMDAYHPRNGQPLPGRPDLPSLLADTAARQFRSPTAVIQAETAQKVNARAASKPGDG
ncbi:hypothetical protein, partial [Klebsiella pneumoniae]|uniref:hypothetical protein n=1 Tax=Klebsiella pneumoniae TaxID=573 RepID=UPI00210C62B8